MSLAVAWFLAIVFLQSGFDKALDFSGNESYLSELLANSTRRKPVAPLLLCVTVLELAGGGVSALATLTLLFAGSITLGDWGALISAAALLMVLFGQRIAQAYADAAVIAPYFMVSCLGIHLFGS